MNRQLKASWKWCFFTVLKAEAKKKSDALESSIAAWKWSLPMAQIYKPLRLEASSEGFFICAMPSKIWWDLCSEVIFFSSLVSLRSWYKFGLCMHTFKMSMVKLLKGVMLTPMQSLFTSHYVMCNIFSRYIIHLWLFLNSEHLLGCTMHFAYLLKEAQTVSILNICKNRFPHVSYLVYKVFHCTCISKERKWQPIQR